jgi:hypothetical protein
MLFSLGIPTPGVVAATVAGSGLLIGVLVAVQKLADRIAKRRSHR